MNGLSYLLDTNIIIGLLKGNPNAIASLGGIELPSCAYSAITRMELLSFPDLTDVEAALIRQLLEPMTYLALSLAIEDRTIEFRHFHRVKLPDAIIAATAQTHGLQLLTPDKKLAAKL
ncbi:MAG: type II toxin-antitoxin system VapC family toxin [Gammaproteobacteria bacterium]